jgi:hypothetical protein
MQRKDRRMKWRNKIGVALVLASLGALAAACGGGDENGQATTEPPGSGASQATLLFLDVDTVRGPEGIAQEDRARKNCVQTNVIPLGGQVVWRIRVYDPVTGQALDDSKLESVVVKLADGQEFATRFGMRPREGPPIEGFWTASFKVPADYAVGVLDYTVVAKDKEGRTGEWKQIKAVPAAALTIVDREPLASMEALPDEAMAAAR